MIVLDFHNSSKDHSRSDDKVIRNKKNYSEGHCANTGLSVNCDENAAYNIWGRCKVEMLYRYSLSEEQIGEVKELISQRGYSASCVNYVDCQGSTGIFVR